MAKKLFLISVLIVLIGIIVPLIINQCTPKAEKNHRIMQKEISMLKSSLLDYYRHPCSYGGGGESWSTVDDLCNWLNCSYPYKTDNGTYHFIIKDDVISIIGTGNVIGKDGATNVRITAKLTGESKSITTTINN